MKAFLLLLLIAPVLTDSCNAFSFVNPPKHRRIGEPEQKVPEVQPQKEATVDEQTEAKNVEEEKVAHETVLPEPTINVEPETTLPEPEEPATKLDPHVKIIIHSAPWCEYCPAAIAEAEKLKDEYEVVVEEHERGFQTSYGYYIDSFPYIEYYYDGKVKLYNYGKRTESQLRRTIEQLK